jgi:hypothetical protein
MHDVARGEHIARVVVRLNVEDRAGAETLKGLPHSTRFGLPGWKDGARQEPIETLRRRRARGQTRVSQSVREEAGRNPG